MCLCNVYHKRFLLEDNVSTFVNLPTSSSPNSKAFYFGGLKKMVISFCELASEKYPIGLIRRIFKKLKIPGAVNLADDKLYIPDQQDVDKPEDGLCWIFTGAIQSAGYGSIKFNKKTYSVHRILYDLWRGNLIPKSHVHHICYIKECVNPFHLLQLSSEEHRHSTMLQNRHAFGENTVCINLLRHKFSQFTRSILSAGLRYAYWRTNFISQRGRYIT